MKRQEKVTLVENLKGDLSDAKLAVVAKYTGLTVADMSDLRNAARKDKTTVRVSKNRLAKIALSGSPFEGLADYLSGQTILMYSEDEIAPAKIAANFAKTHENLVILGGVMNGKKLDVAGVKTLATLPSLDELRGKLIGLLQAPATKIAGVLQAPAGQTARVIAAYSKK